MVLASQLTPGNTITLEKVLYRVESAVKVAPPKGQPFIKTKLRDLISNKSLERNFKPNQEVQEALLQEKKLEYLYPEGKGYLFLDVSSLDQILVSSSAVGKKTTYLKEGVEIKAQLCGNVVISIELPQYLELMVVGVAAEGGKHSTGAKVIQLETGAKLETPPFVEVGDIIKVDTRTEEYIQRV